MSVASSDFLRHLWERAVPTGQVKWYDVEKGFGFLTREDGPDVFVHSTALPQGVTELKNGARVEYGVAQGRRGEQALQVRLLDPIPSVVQATRQASRKSPEEMSVIVEDLIKLLDGVGETLRRGKHPEPAAAKKVASLLRAVAGDLSA